MGQLEEIKNSQITQLKWALSQINKKCKHMPMNLKRKKKKKYTATNEFCKREKDGDLHTKKKNHLSALQIHQSYHLHWDSSSLQSKIP